MAKKFKNKYRNESTRLQNWNYGWNGTYFITICTKNRAPYFGEIENKKMILSQIGELANKFWFTIPDHFSFIKLGNFVVMPNHTHGVLIVNKSNEIGMDENRNDKIGTDGNGTDETRMNKNGTGENRVGENGMDENGVVQNGMGQNRTGETGVGETGGRENVVGTRQCLVPTFSPSEPPTFSDAEPPTFLPAKPPTFFDAESNAKLTKKTIGQSRFQNQGKNTISSIIGSYKSVVTKNARYRNPDFAWQVRFHDHIIRDLKSFENIQNYIATNPENWGNDKFFQ